MDEFPIEIRDSTEDLVISSVIFGTIILNWLMLLFYLIFSAVRNRSKVPMIKSKADRPWYVTGLVVSSTFWMMGTLFTTGHLTTAVNVNHLPSIMIYFVQYLFGVLPWLWLTIDRMLRRYAQVRFVGPEKGVDGAILRISAALIAFIPIMVVGFCAGSLDKTDVNRFGVYDQDDTFEIIMVVFLGCFFLGACFLMFKLRKIMGHFHELIRYTTFTLTTLLFFVGDAMTTLWHALQKHMLAQHLLVGLVWLIVTANLYWVFILAMKPRKLKQSLEEEASVGDVLKTRMNDEDAINHFVDADSAGAQTGVEEEISPSANNMVWLRQPRRKLKQRLEPNFAEFVTQLDQEDTKQLDKDSGYFSHVAPPTKLNSRPLLGLLEHLKATTK